MSHDVVRKLEVLAATTDRSVQNLMAEATDLFLDNMGWFGSRSNRRHPTEASHEPHPVFSRLILAYNMVEALMVAAGACAALVAFVSICAAGDARAQSQSTRSGIVSALLAGRSVSLFFIEPARIGTLSANRAYTLRYSREEGVWLGSGIHADQTQKEGVRSSGAPPAEGNPLVLWGARFHLREDGSIDKVEGPGTYADVKGRVDVYR